MQRSRFIAWVTVAFLTGCVGSQDDLSQVFDLRVLGMALSPPESMAPDCNPRNPASLVALNASITLSTLIADPKGEGRPLEYTLRTCVRQDDRICGNEGQFIELSRGTLDAGVSVLPPFSLGPLKLPAPVSDGGSGFLLEETRAVSTFGGLGGLRVPLVLNVSAGDERIYAQKLMVFNCPIVPGMKQNENPALQGIRLDGEPWPENGLRTLTGSKGIFELDDFAGLEEQYVVPSFELQPIALKEAWKVAWHTTMGRFGPTETSGVDQGGQASRHKTTWTPGANPKEGPVTFWFVVRDGRGGESWTSRSGYYVP
ncbi:MAG: hypothetical protein K1X64_00170 [Myxococcaceae bacterium]|nr:hypothetical protein [Myxococcaceae bacterium]